MQRIADLHAFIIGLDLFSAEQMESEVDDLVITPNCYLKNGALVVGTKDYTARFFIERYPHGQVSEDKLFAQICAWVVQTDDWASSTPTFDVVVEILDAQTANIEFGLTFSETISATADVTGDILFDGVRYAL